MLLNTVSIPGIFFVTGNSNSYHHPLRRTLQLYIPAQQLRYRLLLLI